MKGTIRTTKVLIVEGRDEQNFFEAALRDHLTVTDIQVLPIGGKSVLTTGLTNLMADPGFPAVTSLGIVRDADTTPAGSSVTAATSAFDSVLYSLGAVGLSCPTSHAQFTTTPLRIGIFIMPDGANDGMLETLCLRAVCNDPEYACLTDYLDCLKRHNVVPNNLDKARAHAWLASRPLSDKRVGEAAQAGYWPFSSAAFDALWTFLRAL